jgi:regulatory protein
MESKIYDIKRSKFLIRDYCAKSDRCQYQVLEKLKTYGVSYEVSQEILIELIQENFVNDQRFADSFCSGKFKIKKWGKKKIVFELKKLKISSVCIDSALKTIDFDQYTQTANDLLIKKSLLLKDKNIFVKKKKMADYMIRKGYESEFVWDCIRQLN